MFFTSHNQRQVDWLIEHQQYLERMLDRILRNLNPEEFQKMVAQSMAELTAAVTHATTTKQAALVLIKQMGDKLTELANHPSADEIRALAAQLRNGANALAEAVAEHDKGGGHEEEEE